jgi:hypothetical protein
MRARLISGLLLCAGFATGETCPNPPVASAKLKAAPEDVCIPRGFTDLTIDFFDDYSWKTLIALAPEFEKYMPLWAVFHEDGSEPGYGSAYNACALDARPGDLILASFNGFGDIGQAGDGELLSPLVAQNGRYVHYLTAYNPIAYRHIVENRWYLRSRLPEVPVPRPPAPPVQFPVGSVVVKSAWVDLTGFSAEQRSRFYTRSAVVGDPAGGRCSKTTVGLVGLHIVRKTASRPQWIWSSFEQVDNVPTGDKAAGKRFTFHDGSATPMPAKNPLALIPPAKEPVQPFNVERTGRPLHPKTAATNGQYRDLLKGTAWANYELVMTQWPLQPGDQSVPVPETQAGSIFETFPGDGAVSTFANMSMETFNQSRPAQGCMSCHNRARLTVDFMWSVLEHAYPAKIGLPGAPPRP